MIGRENREMPDWARSLLEFEESMAGKSSAGGPRPTASS